MHARAWWYWGWGSVALLAVLLPLAWFVVIPGTDLPQHVAISRLLWRLLCHDETARAHFALGSLGTPYHLAYALLVPASAVFGPLLGARVALASLAVALVSGVVAVLRQARVAPVWALYAVFIFFGAQFYWGFVAMLCGLPALCWAAWALGREAHGGKLTTRLLLLACGALAVGAHVVFCVPVSLMAAAALWRQPRLWGGASSLLGGATLAALVYVGAHAGAQSGVAWRLIGMHPSLLWTHALGFLGPFDHAAGRLAHVVALGLLIFVSVRRWGSANGWQRGMRLAALLLLVIFLAWPRAVIHGVDHALMLNFRFLCLAELLLVVAMSPSPTNQSTVAVVLCLATLLYGAAQWRVWNEFARQVQPHIAGQAAWPSGNTLAEANVRHVWAPLGLHVGLYETALRDVYRRGIFTGQHVPVVDISP